MTHREARQKLGSRSRRRANTNGKNLGKNTNKGIALKRRYPLPCKAYVAQRVWEIVRAHAD